MKIRIEDGENRILVSSDQTDSVMQYENFGDLKIFRPSSGSVDLLHSLHEKHLRNNFPVGVYKDKDDVNGVFQQTFKFYEDTLNEHLGKLVSFDFLEFVLNEYEIASQIHQLYKDNRLSTSDKIHWNQIGAIFRRSAKYLAEQIVFFQANEAPSVKEADLISHTEKAWACVEEMVAAYILSDQTYSIFPNETLLEILPEGATHVYEHKILREPPDIRQQVRNDAKNRQRFIPSPTFTLDLSLHSEMLGDDFRDSVGVTYFEAIKILNEIVDGCVPPEEGFPIPFVDKEELVSRAAEKLGYQEDAIEKVVSGFTISKERLEVEGRYLWKPKQEYRAYRRAFFEYEYESRAHIVFSKSMAKEGIVFLTKDVVFGKLPSEWITPSLKVPLSKVSNKAGKWFENIVDKNLMELGFKGVKSVKKELGKRTSKIEIPPNIGEIDYLGYSEEEKIILVVECKFVRDTSEPQFFRDDITEFVTSKNSYFKKFRVKTDWVQQNFSQIAESLESTGLFSKKLKPDRLARLFITFVPTLAACFIEDIPCVSLTEFRLDHKALNRYPYVIGVTVLGD